MTPQVPPANDSSPSEQSSAATPGRVTTNARLLLLASIIGLVGGLLALAYYFALTASVTFVWKKLAGLDPLVLPMTPAFHPGVVLITTIGGLCVGLALKALGKPGEIAAVVDNIHLDRGRIDTRQTWPMVVVSLLSITAGGSAGPEAPLVQIVGSLGSWLGDKLKLRGDLVRTLTFCGMGTALGAFFGAPLGGALFALEIPHRRSLEYFEALVPTIIATLFGFFVFRAFVGYDGVIYHLTPMRDVTLTAIAAGVPFGLLGGAIGILFVAIFNLTGKAMHPLHHHTVLLATLAGLLIGLIAQLCPATLFWSEPQLPSLFQTATNLVTQHGLRAAVGILLLVALLKSITVGVTLHGGFRGGFIFPLFFIGGCVGLAITAVFPSLPAAVVILSMMAAVNVAVTKTPISTAVILTTLSGTPYMPALISACFASFLLTTRVSLIRTQRSRGGHSPTAG
jgi:H+/Cl- antiporter ClcA